MCVSVKNLKLSVIKPVFVLMAILGLVSCGGGSNNDFGTSFTLLGFYPEDASIPACGSVPDTGLAGFSIALSNSQNEGNEGNFFGGAYFAYIGLQNAQTGVAVLTEQARVSYDIPGSSVRIPSNSYATNLILGPAEGGASAGGDTETEGEEGEGGATGGPTSSLPESFRNLCNVGYTQIPLVSSDIREFLSFNRGSLPELPFIMNITVTATGVSSAGDYLETNTRRIAVEIVSDVGLGLSDGSSNPVAE